MNIVEAVLRMRDGEIMQTNDFSNNLKVRIDNAKLQFNALQNSDDIGWQDATAGSLWLFTSEFVPYKDKSVIEKAIERECREIGARKIDQAVMHCFAGKIETKDSPTHEFISASLRRIVNLTLDEAANSVKPFNFAAESIIRALKVKE